jgi:hypothetical protein
MSHFATIKAKLTDRAALIAALEKLFNVLPEVHMNPVKIQGWYRDGSSDNMANIVVRAKDIAPTAQPDLGFLWNSETKEYDMLMDDGFSGIRIPNFPQELVKQYQIALLTRELGSEKEVVEVPASGDGAVRFQIRDKVLA